MSEQERVYHTPPEVLVDAVLGNPPLGGITDTPDTPDEAKPTGGGGNQCMSRPEAVMRLMRMMRGASVEDISALRMACRTITKRHADQMGNKWRRAQAAESAKEA